MKKIITLSLCFLAIGLTAQTTRLVTNTNDSGSGSLRDAIGLAVNDDTVRLDPSLLSSGSATITLLSEITFNTKIVIKGVYSQTDTVYISGNHTNRIFNISNTNQINLDSLVLINGTVIGSGGAVNHSGPGVLNIENSIIRSNSASIDGGGVYSTSSVIFTNCTISENYAGYYGGGAHVGDNLGVLLSTVNNNYSATGSGALHCLDSLILLNSTVCNNTASVRDGALYSVVVFIYNSTVYENTSTSTEGGVGYSSDILILSSIVWNSPASGLNIVPSNTPNMSTTGFNIFSDSPIGAITTGLGQDQVNVSESDLNLQALAFHVGTTKTLMPAVPSVAIDNGTITTSFPPQNRAAEVGTRDIGAAEYFCTTSQLFNMHACESYTWIDGNSYASDNNTAQFTILSTNSTVCDTIYTLNLTVGEPNTGDTTAVSCGSFMWYGMEYTASGTATHTLTNASGCDSVVTLNLTVNSLPISTTTLTDLTITADATGLTYQWIDCGNNNALLPGETLSSFTATENGNYALIVSNALCSDTSDCVVIASVSLDEKHDLKSLLLYPNPSTGKIQIELPSAQNARVEVYSSLGQKMAQYEVTKQVNELELPQNKGVYIVKVKTANDTKTLRVVKQ